MLILLHFSAFGQVALFWLAWAFVCEKQLNFQRADQLFNLGLRCHAEPKKVLTQRYQQFRRRMARRFLDTTGNDDGDDVALDAILQQPQQSSLIGQSNDIHALRPLSESSRMPLRQSSPSIDVSVAAVRIPIFEDCGPPTSATTSIVGSRPLSTKSAAVPLAPERERTKENIG